MCQSKRPSVSFFLLPAGSGAVQIKARAWDSGREELGCPAMHRVEAQRDCPCPRMGLGGDLQLASSGLARFTENESSPKGCGLGANSRPRQSTEHETLNAILYKALSGMSRGCLLFPSQGTPPWHSPSRPCHSHTSRYYAESQTGRGISGAVLISQPSLSSYS